MPFFFSAKGCTGLETVFCMDTRILLFIIALCSHPPSPKRLVFHLLIEKDLASDPDNLSTLHMEGNTLSFSSLSSCPHIWNLEIDIICPGKLPLTVSCSSPELESLGRKWSRGPTLAGTLCYLSFPVMTLRQFTYEYFYRCFMY